MVERGNHMYQEQRLEEIIKLLEDRGSLASKEMADASSIQRYHPQRFFYSRKRETSKKNSWRFTANSKAKDSWFSGRAEQSSKEKKLLI